ncbi:MAG: cytochrome P450, partial [Pseudomonadota bacterium]
MPILSQSPRDAGFVQDPHPFYDRARAAGALFQWAEYGHPCSAAHATVSAILRDRRFGRENPFPPEIPDHLDPFYRIERHSMLEREPPAHTRLRGLVLRAFTSRRVAAMEAEVAALCHALIDRFDREVDLLTAYAERIPVIVICRLLGVPEERADDLLRWSHAMVAMYQARRDRAVEDAAVAATLAFRAYLEALIEARRRAPTGDLLSDLIAARDGAAKLTDDELVATVILLLNAGHEATVHGIGNGVKAALESGLPLSQLAEAPGLVEEVLRFTPPLHMFTRFALEPVEVAGHRFETGDVVGLMLAAANRDPATFADPARFDPGRDARAQVSFGAGLHFCVGAPLARLEMAQAL